MIGPTIAHYKILEKLGEGGMGIVYKARDTRLDRAVALKFLPSDLSDEEESKVRLINEAKAAATLNHPNICTIYEIGEEKGELFLAMEYVDGKSLRAILSEGEIAIPTAVDIAIGVTEGLRTAHAKGIVHRDIKPENILLTPPHAAKITDFGLARDLRQGRRSESETIAGTIAYMSPEQLQGDIVDARTDIWSLGVLLYEMISGARPFTGDYDQAIAYAIMHQPLVPLSARRGEVSNKLVGIISRCLEKSPDRRYTSADDLADDLREIRIELQARATISPHSIAILPFADLSAEKNNGYFSEGLTEEIITSLSRLPMIRVLSRATVMSFDRAQKSMRQIASELGVKYLLEGSVRKSGSHLRIAAQLIDASQDIYLWAEKYDGTMKDIFEIQDHVAGKIVKALKMRLTTTEKKKLTQRHTENPEAYQLYLRGRYFWSKRNNQSLRKAISFFEEAIKKDPKYARAWAGIADSYNLLSEYGGISRRASYPKARAAVEKALRYDDKLAEAHTSLACLLMLYEWDWPKAEREFKRALKLDPTYATAHHWYSEWLLYHGRMDEAFREISRAVELDPLSPSILKDKGLILYYLERYDDAIDLGSKSLEMDPGFAAGYRLLSLSFAGKGMIAEATKANQQWGEVGGYEIEARIGLAWCHALGGRREEATSIAAELIAKYPNDGTMLRGAAIVHAALNNSEEAIKYLEEAHAVKSETLSSLAVDPKFKSLRSHPRFTNLLNQLGLSRSST